MPARESRLHYILLPLAALIAILPLILKGCSCGHDFNFHLLNWMEAAQQFTHGNLHPHWAYTPAFNAGEPRFIFYPPISWTIGALLGLILPWTWAPIAYTWLALTAAGFSLYYLANEFATPQAALLAATFYIVNPYMLFTAYERTAYAELLAAAWIPLLLHAILREKVTIPRIAIPVALLWLTNVPAAIMACYTLALLTLIRLISAQSKTHSSSSAIGDNCATNPGSPSSRSLIALRWASRESATAPAHLSYTNNTRLQLAANTTAGTLLGLGISAIYLLPAVYERRYIQIAMAILSGMRIQDNFLFHQTLPGDQNDPFHDTVLHTASVIALTIIILTAVALLIAARQATKPNPPMSAAARRAKNPGAPYLDSEMWASRASATAPAKLPTLTILTIVITFLLTPLSAPIWNHTPELAFLQFPWRLIAILAPILCLTTAIALSPLKRKPIPTVPIALALAVALTAIAHTTFHQPCDEEDNVQARLTLFHSNLGTGPTDEYTPITADNDALTQNNPAYWLSDNPNAKAPANSTPAPAPAHLTLNPPTPQTLILNLRDYPTWHITRNGELITTRQHREDGLIAIPLPAGPSNISITSTRPVDQTLGDIITALSLIILLLTLRKSTPMALLP